MRATTVSGSSTSWRHVKRITQARGDQRRVAPPIALEGESIAVERVAVDLDHEPRFAPQKVDLVAAGADVRRWWG
jgi:hypothetical protein